MFQKIFFGGQIESCTFQRIRHIKNGSREPSELSVQHHMLSGGVPLTFAKKRYPPSNHDSHVIILSGGDKALPSLEVHACFHVKIMWPFRIGRNTILAMVVMYDLAMVSQLEGFESAPKAPEKLYFHVFWVFFYYQIRDSRKLYSKSELYWIPPARHPPTGRPWNANRRSNCACP